jgi:hypothetical protein
MSDSLLHVTLRLSSRHTWIAAPALFPVQQQQQQRRPQFQPQTPRTAFGVQDYSCLNFLILQRLQRRRCRNLHSDYIPRFARLWLVLAWLQYYAITAPPGARHGLRIRY